MEIRYKASTWNVSGVVIHLGGVDMYLVGDGDND